MSGPVPPAFAEVLRTDRELFNAKFAEARRHWPDLDGAAFLAFLRGPAAAVIERIAPGDRVRDVVHAAYDAALILTGERLAGPGGRHPIIDEMWARLLPELAPLVSDQPVRVIGSLTNAVFRMAGTPGARPRAWIDRLLGAAPYPSAADLLKAGQVAAWREGLAHLREGALAAGDALPSGQAAHLVGAPRLDWRDLRERFARDLWWDPAASAQERPRIAAEVGGFRGFGGLFAEPPTVAAADGQILIASAGECWALAADAFGATVHRLDPARLGSAEASRELQVDKRRVRFRRKALPLPPIGPVTSAALACGTVAVTGALTHAVALIAVDDG